MSRFRAIACASAVLALLAAQPAIAQNAAKTEAAALLPAGTLLHLEFDGAAARAHYKDLGLAKILAEPEVRAFLKHLLRWLSSGRAFVESQFEFIVDGEASALYEMLAGKCTISFLGVTETTRQEGDVEWTETMPRLILTWRLGNQAGAAKKLLAFGEEMLQKEAGVPAEACTVAGKQGRQIRIPNGPTCQYLVSDGMFLLGTEPESLAGFVEQMARGPRQDSLAASADYKRVSERVGRPGTLMRAYVDFRGLMGLLAQESQEVDAMLGAFGLDDMRSVGFAMEFDGKGIRDRFVMLADEQAPLMKLYRPSATVRAQKIVPATTGAFFTATLDWSAYYDYMMKAFQTIQPGMAEEVEGTMQHVAEMLGADLRKQVLPMLGNELSMAASWPRHGLIPDVYVLLQVKDKEGCKRFCEDLAKRFGDEIKGGSVEYLGHTINYFGPARLPRIPDVPFRPQMRISWTMVEDYLVITPWPQAAKNLIKGLSEGTPRLEDRKDFAATLAHLRQDRPDSGRSSLVYMDTTSMAAFCLDNLVPLLQSIMPDNFGDVPIDIPWARFPPTETITRHLVPVVGTGSVGQGELYGEYYSPTGVVVPYLGLVAGISAALVTGAADSGWDPEASGPALEAPIAPARNAMQMKAELDLVTLTAAVRMFQAFEARLPRESEWPTFLAKGSKNHSEPYVDASRLKDGDYVDPWGNPYVYKRTGQRTFTLMSYGADGKPGGEGLNADLVRSAR